MNLDPVRDALLADARADADRMLADADRFAGDRVERANREAAALIATAGREGAAAAADLLARQRGATRREAREIVLGEQRRALDELRARARAAARELVHEDGYDEIVARLRALGEERLGADVTISVDPDGEPGIIAGEGHRRVDYRLIVLADRAIDALGSDVATLWQ